MLQWCTWVRWTVFLFACIAWLVSVYSFVSVGLHNAVWKVLHGKWTATTATTTTTTPTMAYTSSTTTTTMCDSACQKRVVDDWVKKRLRETNIIVYRMIPGSAGMGSIRQELLNLMTVARAMNLTPVLSSTTTAVRPLFNAYDIPHMRYAQITSPNIGFTLIFESELPNYWRGQVKSDCSEPLYIPHKPT